jgi:predicted metalloprotease with PDZ domain
MRPSSYAAASVLVVAASLVSVPLLSAQDVTLLSSQRLEKRDRAVLGITTTSGGPRDTLGVLVSDVTVGGPADKAGIEEGDRIVSIGDVDLRLAPPDATDAEMRGVMGRRLAHAIAKRAPGDVVELKVWHNGQFVTRKVTTVKANEVFAMPVQLEMRRFPTAPPTLNLPQLDSNWIQFQIYRI